MLQTADLTILYLFRLTWQLGPRGTQLGWRPCTIPRLMWRRSTGTPSISMLKSQQKQVNGRRGTLLKSISKQNVIPLMLSRRKMRLLLCWVNAKWHSSDAETTQKWHSSCAEPMLKDIYLLLSQRKMHSSYAESTLNILSGCCTLTYLSSRKRFLRTLSQRRVIKSEISG